MAIQFSCSACSKPIEVDPEWAGRPVDCPYCGKRVGAPLASTYRPEPAVPMARPTGGGPAFEPVGEVRVMPQAVPTDGGNAIAVWALVLSLSSLACFVTALLIMGVHFDDIEPLIRMNEEGKTFREMNQAMSEHYDGQFPGWLLGASLVFFAGLGIWVAGVVCGIVGVRRKPRKKLAIAALVISGLILFVAVP